MELQPLTAENRGQVDAYIAREWSGPVIVTRGNLFDTRQSHGFVAMEAGVAVGAVLYEPRGEQWEISGLFSLRPGRGIGSALLGAVINAAWQKGARRIWLVTTNDNLNALGFYQRRGWNLAAVHIDALDTTRRLKPTVPELGENGIPLRHEFEFEWLL